MSTNSLSTANIQFDLKTIQDAVKNLGQNLKSKNTSVGNQHTVKSSKLKQQKSNNSSPLEDPHQQTAKVINSHTELNDEAEKKENFSTDFKKEIDNHPNLSDDEKTKIKGDHQSNSRFLDMAREHLNSAKKISDIYPKSKLHLDNASNNLNKYHKGAMAVINKFENALTTSSKDTINKTTQALRNKLSSTKSKNQTNGTKTKTQNNPSTPKQ